MSFWIITNPDFWLSAGVIFCIIWLFYKALQSDAEKHEERIKFLEDNQEDIHRKLRLKQK